MPHCPTCSYSLVFLEKRLRYKCAKCGRAFLRKFVENRDFRLWNRQLRSFEMRELMSEIGRIEEEKQKMAELRELKRTSQALRVLFVGQGRKISASSEERRVREVEYNRKWRENNPEKGKNPAKKVSGEAQGTKIFLSESMEKGQSKQIQAQGKVKPLENKASQNRPGNAQIHSQQDLKTGNLPVRFPLLVFRNY